MCYYTILHKQTTCPFWKCPVTLEAKYRYSKINKESREAYFTFAECPIMKNIELPERKRDKKYSCYAFCKMYPCSELSNFEKVISDI